MSRPWIEPVTSRSPERILYQLSYRSRSILRVDNNVQTSLSHEANVKIPNLQSKSHNLAVNHEVQTSLSLEANVRIPNLQSKSHNLAVNHEVQTSLSLETNVRIPNLQSKSIT